MTATLPCSDCGYASWLKCLGCETSICDGECSITKGLTIRERRFCSSDCEAKFPDYSSETDSLNDEEGFDCEICKARVSYAGCCSDGNCPHKVEGLCQDCGHWNADKEQWFCPKCYEAEQSDANTHPYTPCHDCGQRKSCGSYNSNKEWLCEDCYEDEDDHPTCDKCEVPLTWADNMHKGYSVPEPSPYGYVCEPCHKILVPPIPDEYKRCMLKGQKYFCKNTDPTTLELFARPDDNSVGEWVGTYDLKTMTWLVKLE
jgi:hypothetical protein